MVIHFFFPDVSDFVSRALTKMKNINIENNKAIVTVHCWIACKVCTNVTVVSSGPAMTRVRVRARGTACVVRGAAPVLCTHEQFSVRCGVSVLYVVWIERWFVWWRIFKYNSDTFLCLFFFVQYGNRLFSHAFSMK